MEKGLEDSLGDEGYAAWLQYREIQRFKRDRKASALVEVDCKADGGGGVKNSSQWVMVDKGKGWEVGGGGLSGGQM